MRNDKTPYLLLCISLSVSIIALVDVTRKHLAQAIFFIVMKAIFLLLGTLAQKRLIRSNAEGLVKQPPIYFPLIAINSVSMLGDSTIILLIKTCTNS